jgi:LSD1 subclass zinc finger protein
MRFTNKRNDTIVNGIRPGFTQKDSIYLNRQTHSPKTIIFSAEELEGEPETRQYWCVCRSPLTYLKGSNTIWQCSECLSHYDINIQDSPIKDPTDFKLTPYSSLRHYPVYDEDDPNTLFVEGIDLNNITEDDLESRSFEDKRVQHINLHNVTFADAILKGALSARKKQEDNE